MFFNTNMTNLKPEEMYYIEKPDLTKIDKSRMAEKLEESGFHEFRRYFEKTNEPKYLYWDKLKYKNAPQGLTKEEFWSLVRQFRNLLLKKTPIKAENGDYFKWIRLPCTEEFLHKIDISSGGQVFATMETLSDMSKQKFISKGVLEEAIASSQLEGAHTTRQVARKMIIEKRQPKNVFEQMILNNYNTMLALDEDYKNQELSEELLFEIHRMLTQKTIEESKQGRFRKNKDNVVVQGYIGSKEYTTHIPPKEAFIKNEIGKLIEFANDNEKEFLHPIIKAIFIHFWVGYLHPFADGNGRLARALFYWYLLRKNYWTFMYLPISTIIKRALSQYAMAYIYSEQDSCDMTYFYDFHLRKIMESLESFNVYIKEKVLENKAIDKILSKDIILNDRQKHLVHYLISGDNIYATVTSHGMLNKIARQTSAKDIKILEKKNLVEGNRSGKFIRYMATEKLLRMANRK